jgi:ATP synthase protein I
MAEEQGGDEPGEGASFEQRLRAARERARLEAPPQEGAPKPDPLIGSPWGIAMRVGVELVAALAVGVGIGWLMDRWLHTKPVFLAIFVVLGSVAGVRNVWRQFAPRS